MTRPQASDPSASTDVVIVGAGVIGLALAHKLAHAGRSVVVLERESRIGTVEARERKQGAREQEQGSRADRRACKNKIKRDRSTCIDPFGHGV